MGYTHYWYREKEIAQETFSQIVGDLKKLLPIMQAMGVKLAGGSGEGEPVFNENEICFNGLTKCGHKRQELGIAWPSDTARGIHNGNGQVLDGSWFAGAKINERCCGGDCSHETFYFPKVLPESSYGYQSHKKDKSKLFEFTKTAFKPYDFAVNCALIIAKHYLGSKILVHSDGELNQWLDAVFLCQKFLGYGDDFALDED